MKQHHSQNLLTLKSGLNTFTNVIDKKRNNNYMVAMIFGQWKLII